MNVWVTRNQDGWKVKVEGRPSSEPYSTQEEAIEAGRKQAKELKGELIVQNKWGEIRQKDSFGNDPPHIKG